MGRKIEKAADELSPDYARILVPRRLDPRIVAAVQLCLRRLPERLPLTPRPLRAVEHLVDRLLRVAAIGCLDFTGTPRDIDVALARRLGEPEAGARWVYTGLKALLGRTVLVEYPARQRWIVRLASVADPSSPLHLAFLGEFESILVLAPDRETSDERVRHAEMEALRRELEAERRRRAGAEEALRSRREDLEGDPGAADHDGDSGVREGPPSSVVVDGERIDEIEDLDAATAKPGEVDGETSADAAGDPHDPPRR